MVEVVWWRGLEVVWWRGRDGVYYRVVGGPVRKSVFEFVEGPPDWWYRGYKLVQAADQPDYILWPQ